MDEEKVVKSTAKSIKITVRCTDEEYKYIRKAAYASEQSMNTFVLEAALDEAKNYFDPEPLNEPGSGGI